MIHASHQESSDGSAAARVIEASIRYLCDPEFVYKNPGCSSSAGESETAGHGRKL